MKLLFFCRYQHSRHLVTTLNQFADVKADLPKGWEKKLNKEGKVSDCIEYLCNMRLIIKTTSHLSLIHGQALK